MDASVFPAESAGATSSSSQSLFADAERAAGIVREHHDGALGWVGLEGREFHGFCLPGFAIA